ncbi:hypothetical protein QQ045_032122 [Rhodiola kirilowii]
MAGEGDRKRGLELNIGGKTRNKRYIDNSTGFGKDFVDDVGNISDSHEVDPTSFSLLHVYIFIADECRVDLKDIVRTIFFARAPFPANFKDILRTIFKKLFPVYTYIPIPGDPGASSFPAISTQRNLNFHGGGGIGAAAREA